MSGGPHFGGLEGRASAGGPRRASPHHVPRNWTSRSCRLSSLLPPPADWWDACAAAAVMASGCNAAGRRAEAGGVEGRARLQWPIFLVVLFVRTATPHSARARSKVRPAARPFSLRQGLHRPQSSRDAGERDSGMRGFISSRTLSFLARAKGPPTCSFGWHVITHAQTWREPPTPGRDPHAIRTS
jgi:hypothetical protein